MQFGDAAVRLCGLAATALGWRADEFWNATPQELAACLGLQAPAVRGPDGDTLAELMRRFPDD